MMRRMIAVAVFCLLATPAVAQAQTPQQQGCAADAAQFVQAMGLYIAALEAAVPGQVPNPQTAALSLVRSDALLLDWCSV